MNVVIIGAGNLATNLSFALRNAGFNIVQVYSRTYQSAELLANKLSASFTNNIKEIEPHADLYIASLSDDSLLDIIQQVNFSPSLLVHTSGSLPMDLLKKYAKDYGVIYPLQTFTKNKISDFKTIPICIEANNKDTEKKLIEISNKISTQIHLFNSDQRSKIHLAAVFACNFTNHMYTIAEEILQKENVSLDILKPLLKETLSNALISSPLKAQTGPAMRNDIKIMTKHKEMLTYNPLFEKIYSFVSESIYKNKLGK